eukprot:6801018-Pyramimonas_sp.AAC.1
MVMTTVMIVMMQDRFRMVMASVNRWRGDGDDHGCWSRWHSGIGDGGAMMMAMVVMVRVRNGETRGSA